MANNVYLVHRDNGEEYEEYYAHWIDSVWDSYEGAVWHIENELEMVKHTDPNPCVDFEYWDAPPDELGVVPTAWIKKYPVYTCL